MRRANGKRIFSLRKRLGLRKLCVGLGVFALLAGGVMVWFSQKEPVEAAIDTTKFYGTQLSGSSNNTCGVALNGRAYCWGSWQYGALGNGSTTNVDALTPVAVDVSGVLAGQSIRSVGVGSSYACALASNDRVYCWGRGNNGEMGNGSTADSPVPVAVDASGVLAGKTIRSISVGRLHACAIASDNQAYCWGSGSSGSLGNNSNSNSAAPVAVTTTGALAGKTLNSISAGDGHTCAIASDNQAYCWGSNIRGQLGNNSVSTSLVPVAVNTSGVLAGKTLRSISAGNMVTCAVASDRQAYCWGVGSTGAMGNNTTTLVNSTPVAVSTAGVLAGKTIESISVGNGNISSDSLYVCAIASDGMPYCWGYGASGQLGNGASANGLVPVGVTASGVLAGKSSQSIVAAGGQTCLLATDNQAYCWGAGSMGRLGNDTAANSAVPSVVLNYDPPNVQDVYRVYENANSLTPGAPLAADNTPGPLAVNPLGDATDFRVRASVANTLQSTSGFKKITGGRHHYCGLSFDNKVYCWGFNGSGQLGNGNNVNQPQPVAVVASGAMANKSIIDIDGGGDFTCAIAADYTAYCWGLNTDGQLGNNSQVSSNVPVLVGGGSRFKKITAGNFFACAIGTDDRPYCWGPNDAGRNGNGNGGTGPAAGYQLIPGPVIMTGVLAGKTVKDISSGAAHTCVVASDNLVYCWGWGLYGQLGNNGNAQANAAPVATVVSGALAGKTVKSVSVGYIHSCALASDNQNYCWGYNYSGQLGIGSRSGPINDGYNTPQAVQTSGALAGKTSQYVNAQASGTGYTIASDGALYAWGFNGNPAVGDALFSVTGTGNGTSTELPSPTPVVATGVLAGKRFAAAIGSDYGGCVLDTLGKVYCWGNNTQGQLGKGSIDANNHLVPEGPVVTTGVTPVPEPSIPGGAKYKLQYAKRTESTCALQNANQSASFAAVTSGTSIRWKVNPGVPDSTLLTNSNAANDPVSAYPYLYQYYVSGGTSTFTAANIPAGSAGLWDFSLSDFSADKSSNYCFRLIDGDDALLTAYNNYPEITTAQAQLAISILDASNQAVVAPNVPFPTKIAQTSCQSSAATLGTTSQKIRVINTTNNPNWGVSMAATGGSTAKWTDDMAPTKQYSFNDSAGSGCTNGQLAVGPTAAVFTPRATFANTGISAGSNGLFASGTVDAVSLATADATANTNAYWDITNVGLTQQLPAGARPGNYSVDMTLTLVAQ